MADVEFRPDVVFLLFIPPLVFRGAYLAPWRDFKGILQPPAEAQYTKVLIHATNQDSSLKPLTQDADLMGKTLLPLLQLTAAPRSRA
ncbi:MAG: hypothetical protein JO139_18075, partial [Alphaproteobacteria bacterium]|nr:hypothetical protein [Alphaproteobacteria bacterium]